MPELMAVDWLLVTVCVVTYGLLAGELVGIVRAALRLRNRAERMAEAPLFIALTEAAEAADRIANASLEAQALLMRGAWALARIRATVVSVAGFARTLSGR